MVRKSKGFEFPGIPDGESIKIPVPAALTNFRDLYGMSQEQLAKESGVSRSIIANYESKRTAGDRISIDKLLDIYRALSVKEQPTKEIHGMSIREALIGLLWYKKFLVNKRLHEIDGQIEILKKRRERELRVLADVESEEKQVRAVLATKSH